MTSSAAGAVDRQRRPHVPAVVVAAVLGVAVVVLMCVSGLVTDPAPASPVPGLGSAVTRTPVTGAWAPTGR